MNHTLSFTESQHEELQKHLHSGDGLETAAIMLCHHGKAKSGSRLMANELILIPPDVCEKRTSTRLTWPFADYLPPGKIEEIESNGLSVFTIHSHPDGTGWFSPTDDKNDRKLFRSVCCWFYDDRPNGSAIMMPDGKVIARVVNLREEFIPIQNVVVVGKNIRIWKQSSKNTESLGAGIRVSQTFGKGTFNLLRNLHVGVVGCSGTGSIVVELLARNCIGHLTIVDPDCIEERNLNRIINAMRNHAEKNVPKVTVLQQAVKRMGTGVHVNAYQSNTGDKAVVEALLDCDVIFGCVDSAEGRYHLECIASAYFLPYFDIGVNLEAGPDGAISQGDAVAQYMHPENADLMSRGGYTSEQLTAEAWYRTDRKHYERQRKAGYLAEVGEDQPAVMSINMQAACMAFNDFLARLHGFRLDDNDDFSEQRFRLVHGHYDAEKAEMNPSSIFKKYSGMGDRSFLMQKLRRTDEMD